MQYKLSQSKLNLLEDCQRCFWLSAVKKVDRPSSPMASIVIKMDSIIKQYFDRYRKLGELPPIIKNKIKGKLPTNMPKTLYYKFNENIMLMGRPDDFLETEDGFIVPFDHKTKSKSPEDVHHAYQLQLDVYSFLLYANRYKTKDTAFLAYYYPEHCELHNGMDMHCKILEVKTNPLRTKILLEKANKILNEEVPQKGKNCEFCEWGKIN